MLPYIGRERDYLREPRRGFFSEVCRTLAFLREGFEMMKVPLPTYSALNNFSSAKRFLLLRFVYLLYRALSWNKDGHVRRP
jgi:hypothetical protein